MVVVVVGVAAACANDFDALFEPSAAPDASVDGNAPPNDAAVEVDTSTDAGTTHAPRCAPLTPACPVDAGCDSDDEDCKFACLGCECACNYTCRKKPRSDDPSCIGTCAGGTACTINCGTGGPCDVRATDSDLTFTCDDLATSCTARCEGKSNKCDVTCDIDGDCKIDCRDDAPCLLSCGTSAKSCELDCKSGKLKTCGSANMKVCNRECPN